MNLTETEQQVYSTLIYGGLVFISRKNTKPIDIKSVETDSLKSLHQKISEHVVSMYQGAMAYNNLPQTSRKGFAIVDEFMVLELMRVQNLLQKEINVRL